MYIIHNNNHKYGHHEIRPWNAELIDCRGLESFGRTGLFLLPGAGQTDEVSSKTKLGPYCFQRGPRFEFHRFGGSFRSSGTPAPGGANNSWLPPAPPHSAEPAEVAIWAKVVAYVRTLLLHRPCFGAFHQALAGHALTLSLLPLPSPPCAS